VTIDRMRIGLVSPYSLTVPGGVQAQVLGLARQLRRAGHEARVLGPCDGPPPEAFVTPLGNSLPTAANGSVAPLAPDSSSDARLIAEATKGSQERMKRELVAFFQEVTRSQPIVLFFDDLHWADVSTIDLLTHLASRFQGLRLLVIATFRPSDLLLAKHPFVQIKPDLQARGLYRELATNRRDVRLIVVRASDTPTYVQYGGADLGIAGRDVLAEHGGAASTSRSSSASPPAG
jgi:hypothetical protein